MLITTEYKELNQQLHETNQAYGTSGQKYAEHVAIVAAGLGVREILDYGCGKCTLSNALPQFQWQLYDPCIPRFSTRPTPHDLVVCTDVLEHVEHDCLDAVLLDLAELTRAVLFVQVATRPAKKTLPDGRNTHQIVRPPLWWLEKFDQFGFSVSNLNVEDGGFIAIFNAPGEAENAG